MGDQHGSHNNWSQVVTMRLERLLCEITEVRVRAGLLV